MPGALDKIFGPIEEKTGSKIKHDIYYSDLDLTEGEKRDPKDQSNIKGGVGFDVTDKKPFLYAEGKRGSFNAGVEAKSKNDVSGNIGYNVDENTKVGITASKDDYGKSVNIGIKKDFNKGGKVSKISKGRQAIVKKFGHEGAIDPKKAQITKLLKHGGEAEIGKGKDYIKDLL